MFSLLRKVTCSRRYLRLCVVLLIAPRCYTANFVFDRCAGDYLTSVFFCRLASFIVSGCSYEVLDSDNRDVYAIRRHRSTMASAMVAPTGTICPSIPRVARIWTATSIPTSTSWIMSTKRFNIWHSLSIQSFGLHSP